MPRVLSKAALPSLLLVGLVLLASITPAASDDPARQAGPQPGHGCTSIEVGRLASADGSVITGHTCDGKYRTWLNVVRHQTQKEATTKIYAGKMDTEFPEDLRGLTQTGEIPQVAETYQFLNTAYPCLNEYGLGIGESSIGGRRELYNPEGMFRIEEIERLMLERCRTAREAIRLAGELVKQYGYGDHGECLTIGDANEVWHFEIFGAGRGRKGAVWAAVRIPDDHVGISANISRIPEIDLKNPDRYMASDNIYQVAQDLGWWDPKSGVPFKWWRVFGTGGVGKPYWTRDLYVLSSLAPLLKLNEEMEELPFSVKPEKKVSVRDVLRFYRDPYEGTDLDMAKNLLVPKRTAGRQGDQATQPGAPDMITSPIASAWMPGDMMALVNALKPGTVRQVSTIPNSFCSYATVIQIRGWLPPAVGAICWFAFDNPAMSARIPIFAGTTELPPSFAICGQHRFRMDSADWAFRRTNRLATLKWGNTREEIRRAIAEFEDKAFADLPVIEREVGAIIASKTPGGKPFTVSQFLTNYTGDMARAAVQRYIELGDKFWMLFAMGL